MSGLAIEPLNPEILPPATGNYAHGVQVDGAQRMVFVSGQVPWGNEHGRVPETFEAQCRMVWRNVLSVLAEAGMGIRNLVKVTTYLSDRQYRALNSKIREEVLGRTCRPSPSSSATSTPRTGCSRSTPSPWPDRSTRAPSGYGKRAYAVLA